jgi:DHA1 family bicyclomycin/chloramphenicol resistance-like MFS transporter
MSTTVQRAPSRAEFIALIAALMAANALAIDVMLPALPDMAADFGVSGDNDRQFVISAYMLGFGLAQIVYGPLSDRFGRRAPLLAGLAIYTVSALLAAFAPTFAILLALRFVQGIGAAATRVIATSVVRDLYAGRAMAEVMSLVFMVFMAVPILAPGLGQLVMLATGNWHSIFVFMGVLAIALVLWTIIRLPETLAPENRRPLSVGAVAGAFRIVVTNRLAFCYGLAGMFMFSAIFTFISTSQQIYVEIYDLGVWFPVAFAVPAALMSIGSFLNSRMVRRLGMRRVSHTALLIFIAFSASWVLLSAVGFMPLWLFMTHLSIIMVCFGWIASNANSLAMEPLGNVAGTASSVFGFVQTIGGAFIGGFIGQMYNGTVLPTATGYLAMGVLTLICILIAERGRLFGVGQEYAEPAMTPAK